MCISYSLLTDPHVVGYNQMHSIGAKHRTHVHHIALKVVGNCEALERPSGCDDVRHMFEHQMASWILSFKTWLACQPTTSNLLGEKHVPKNDE